LFKIKIGINNDQSYHLYGWVVKLVNFKFVDILYCLLSIFAYFLFFILAKWFESCYAKRGCPFILFVFQIWSSLFWFLFFFALGSFLKLIFFSISSFDIKLVRNWTLWFFTIGWSWSHDLDHRFEMLTRIEINLFYILLFNDFTFQCHHSPFCVWYNHIFIGE
jgi:hypothetical protein